MGTIGAILAGCQPKIRIPYTKDLGGDEFVSYKLRTFMEGNRNDLYNLIVKVRSYLTHYEGADDALKILNQFKGPKDINMDWGEDLYYGLCGLMACYGQEKGRYEWCDKQIPTFKGMVQSALANQ